MTRPVLLALLLLLASSFFVQGTAASATDQSTSTTVNNELAEEIAVMLRGTVDSYDGYGYELGYDGYYGDEASEAMHGRKLWGGWSWNNLLFHLHACKPPTAGDFQDCPSPSSSSSSSSHHKHPHLLPRCDCPDCSARGAYNFEFCSQGQSDTGSGYGEEEEDEVEAEEREGYAAEEANYETYDGTSGTNEESSKGTQNASYIFNPLAYVIAGSAAVLIVGAIVFKKRESEVEDDKKEGMLVSKRMGLMSKGGGVPDLDTVASEPDFIEMQDEFERSRADISQIDESIEMEAPSRLSSYRAMT